MSEGPVRSTYRHRLPVRLGHWTNVISLFVLLMSGLQIFNAHPALYWGKISSFDRPLLAMIAFGDGHGGLRGVTRVAGHEFTTTGVFGASRDPRGHMAPLGFPKWATIPGERVLSQARRWHFFFAWIFVVNGLLFLAWAAFSGHLRRDLWPTGADWRGMGRSIVDHLRFKHPTGEAATRYNILQKLAYLVVLMVFLPGVVLMGLCMSPHMDSVLGWLVDLVGGRQSARTLHFIFAMGLLTFVAIHVFMVLVSGPVNQLRSMITGRYDIHDEPPPVAAAPEMRHD